MVMVRFWVRIRVSVRVKDRVRIRVIVIVITNISDMMSLRIGFKFEYILNYSCCYF